MNSKTSPPIPPEAEPRSADELTHFEQWEGEGGGQILPALGSLSSKLGDNERQILECLGAALVSKWSELPTDIQREIFEHAARTTYDLPGLRAQIARFLHLHKDDNRGRERD